MLAFALLLAIVAQDRTTGPVSDDEPAPTATPRCGTTPDEITVCGDADPSRFRVRTLPPRYRQPPLRPQFTLPGGGTGTVEAVQRGTSGASVPSAMLTLRIPLGGKKKTEARDEK